MKTNTATLNNLIKAAKAQSRTVKSLDGANEYYKNVNPIVGFFDALTADLGSFTIKLAISKEGTLYRSEKGRLSVWANFAASNTEVNFMVTSKLSEAMEALIGADRNLVEEFGSHEEAGLEAFQLILPLLRTVKVGQAKDGSRDGRLELFR